LDGAHKTLAIQEWNGKASEDGFSSLTIQVAIKDNTIAALEEEKRSLEDQVDLLKVLATGFYQIEIL
jgi:hypothetical protein